MSDAIGRARMATPEMIGGPGTRAEEMIPIVIEDSIPRDVVCYVPHVLHSARKERAVQIINALNPAPAPAAAETLASVTEIEEAMGRGEKVSIGTDGVARIVRFAALELGMREALRCANVGNSRAVILAVLARAFHEAGLDPNVTSPDVRPLEDFYARGHTYQPGIRTEPVEPLVGGVGAAQQWPSSSGVQMSSYRDGDSVLGLVSHDLPPAAQEERREHEPGLGVDYRDGYDEKTAKGRGYQVRASDVPEAVKSAMAHPDYATTMAAAGVASTQTQSAVEEGYKPRDDAAAAAGAGFDPKTDDPRIAAARANDVSGHSEHIKVDGTDKPAS